MVVENHHLNRRIHLHSWLFFHCHVSFPGCTWILPSESLGLGVSYGYHMIRTYRGSSMKAAPIDYGCVHFLFADLVQVILTWLPTSYPHRIFLPVPNVEEDLFYTNFANWRIQHIQRSAFFLVTWMSQEVSKWLVNGL